MYYDNLYNYVVGLTNISPASIAPVYKPSYTSYTVCAQHNGEMFGYTTTSVDCARAARPFRYVVVQGSHSTEKGLCLAEVAVYARRKYKKAVVKVRGARGAQPPASTLAPLLESEPSLPTAGPKLLNSNKNHNVRCRINKF